MLDGIVVSNELVQDARTKKKSCFVKHTFEGLTNPISRQKNGFLPKMDRLDQSVHGVINLICLGERKSNVRI